MPQTAVRTCLAAVLLCVALPPAHADSGDFFFKPKDRILFLGDSITEEYRYPEAIEYYLVTRFPKWDLTFFNAGKIIGHLGCNPFDFFDAAKRLPDYNQYRYENAVRDLTVYARRETSPPRYELTDHARKVLRIIIGPAPDDPEYRRWWEGRLVSVRLAGEQEQPVEWAEEPPVPLEPAKEDPPAEPPPKKAKRSTRKKAG